MLCKYVYLVKLKCVSVGNDNFVGVVPSKPPLIHISTYIFGLDIRSSGHAIEFLLI